MEGRVCDGRHIYRRGNGPCVEEATDAEGRASSAEKEENGSWTAIDGVPRKNGSLGRDW